MLSTKDQAQIELGGDLLVELVDGFKRFFQAEPGSLEETSARNDLTKTVKRSFLVIASAS